MLKFDYKKIETNIIIIRNKIKIMILSENINKDWLEIIETESKKPYFQEINTKITPTSNKIITE